MTNNISFKSTTTRLKTTDGEKTHATFHGDEICTYYYIYLMYIWASDTSDKKFVRPPVILPLVKYFIQYNSDRFGRQNYRNDYIVYVYTCAYVAKYTIRRPHASVPKTQNEEIIIDILNPA